LSGLQVSKMPSPGNVKRRCAPGQSARGQAEVPPLPHGHSSEPEQLVSLADPSLPTSAMKTVSTLSDIYDRDLVGTIGWAKQVPGFPDFTLNDQMKLLQSSWTEIGGLTTELSQKISKVFKNSLSCLFFAKSQFD